jgi:hypothetical protein
MLLILGAARASGAAPAAPRTQLSTDDVRSLQKALGAMDGPLARLSNPLIAARAGSTPTTATVKSRLVAMRELELDARALLESEPSPSVRAKAHLALAVAWAELADLEQALALEGEGDGPTRVAVRQIAQDRAADARALAFAEATACAREPGGPPGSSGVCQAAAGAPLGSRSLGEELQALAPAVQACWQEHLASQNGDVRLELTATLTVVHDGPRVRTQQATLLPVLQGPRVRLGECLTVRLLGLRAEGAGDADAVEVPLRLGEGAR